MLYHKMSTVLLNHIASQEDRKADKLHSHTKALCEKSSHTTYFSIEYSHSPDNQSDELAKAEKENSYDY